MVSSNALSVALETSVTNEIPHLSIYNILNSNLKQEWAKELVGKVDINYIADRTSTKIINGQESPNYKPLSITYTDANTGALVDGEIPKIDFTVEGAIETEMDYLMHEKARYLSKLYPDDFNSLKTLTAAERQSYFNEALHLIHSYFDTEQIELEDEADSLYFKDKFITGITPIRGTTGTYQQEEFLLQLLNLFGISTYSGFKTFMSDKQATVFSGTKDLDIDVPTIQYTYILNQLDKISKAFSEELKAKLDTYTLKNFLPESSTSEFINLNAFLNSGAISFKKSEFKNFPELLDSFSSDLVDWFQSAIKSGKISSNARLDALSNLGKGFSEDWRWSQSSDSPEYKILRANAQEYKNWVPLQDGKFTLDAFNSLEGSFCISNLPFSEYYNQYLVKFGLSSYTEYYREALNTLIAKGLKDNFLVNQKLQKLVKSAANSKLVGLLVQVKGLTLAEVILSNEELVNFIKDTEELTPGVNCKNNFVKSLLYITDLETCTFQVDTEDIVDLTFQVYNLHTDLPVDQAYIWNWEGSTYEVSNTESGYILAEVTEMPNKDIKVLTAPVRDKSVLRDSTRSITMEWESQTKVLTFTRKVGGESETKKASFILEQGLQGNEVHQVLEGGNKYVGRLVFFKDFFDRKLLDSITQKKTFTSTEDLETVSYVASEQVSLRLASDYDFCLLQLEIDYLVELNKVFDFNFSWVTESIEYREAYLYAPKPVVSVNQVNKDDFIPATLVRDKVFFKSTELNTFRLRTYPAEFLSTDSVRIEKDIVDLVKEQGRLRSLLISSLGGTSPVVVNEAYIQNGSCYLHLTEEDKFNFFSLKDNQGYILLDLDDKATYKATSTSEFSRREIVSRSCYNINDGEFYLYKENFEGLRKAHLNYYLENIYAQTVDVYSKDGLLEKFGLYVPISLTETGYVTICDLKGQLLWKKVLKSLLTENKSLYLNSCLKFIRNAPLVPQLLVWNEQYQTLSYTYNSLPPASITFCNLDEVVESYPPLKGVMDAIEDGSGTEMNLEDLESLFSTVKMVWGNVVWDANITKSLKSLRTIWGGYLSSFELKRSNDAIPEEEILKFLNNNEVDLVTRNLETFSYSYNKGSPDVGLNITSEIPVTKADKTLRLPEFYETALKPLYDTVAIPLSGLEPPVGKQYRVIETAFLKGNSYNLDKNILEEKSLPLLVRNISFWDLDEEDNKTNIYSGMQYFGNPEWMPSFVDETFKAKKVDESGSFTYKGIKAIYNRPLLSEEKPLGFFQGMNFPDDDYALQFFLEYCVYLSFSKNNFKQIKKEGTKDLLYIFEQNSNGYKNSSIKMVNGTEIAFNPKNFNTGKPRDFLELLVNIENPIQMQELNLQVALEDSKEIFEKSIDGSEAFPAVVRLFPSKDGRGPQLETSIFWFTEDESGKLVLNKNVFTTDAHPVILKSLLKTYFKPTFVSSPEHYETFVKRFSYYTTNLPNDNFTFNLKTALDIVVKEGKDTKKGSDIFENFKENFSNVDLLAYNESVYQEGRSLNVAQSLENVKQVLSEGNLTTFEDSLSYRVLQEIKDFTEADTLSKLRVEYKDTDLAVKNLEETFELIPNYKVFKEYKPTTIEFTTSEPNSKNSDTLKCTLNFDEDLPVNKGYVLLKDIKVPNKRTTYSPAREIQLVDRNYTLENLKSIVYYTDSEDGTDIFNFVVTNQTVGSLTNSIEDLTPISGTKVQEILPQTLTLGSLYSEKIPDNVGYTFYKRKFISAMTVGSDGRTLTLTDESLASDENFSLLDHLSVGDKVTLKLLESKVGKTEMGSATFSNTSLSEVLDTNYKLIAIKTEVESGSVVQKALLSAPGSLVSILISNQDKVIKIQRVWSIPNCNLVAYEAGGLVYVKLQDNRTLCLGEVEKLMASNSPLVLPSSDFSEPYLPSEIPSFETSYIQPTGTHTVSANTDWLGYFTDGTDNFILSQEEKDELIEYHKASGQAGEVYFEDLKSLPVPALVQDTIPFEKRDGALIFDNLDRALFMPDDLEEFSTWIDHPSLIQDFKSEPEYRGASLDLKTVNRSTLISLIQEFLAYSFKELNNSEAGVGPDTTFSLTEEEKVVSLIKLLLQNPNASSFKLTDLYYPSFEEKDMPVVILETKNQESLTKVRKVKVIKGHTGTKLLDSTLEDLRTFVEVLGPVWYLNKKVATSTGWSVTQDYGAIWDQLNSSLVVLDSLGQITQKVFFPELGYIRPILNDGGYNNFTRQTPVYFNTGKKTGTEIFNTQNTYLKINTPSGLTGVYSWLKSLSLSTLQTAFPGITSSDWDSYVNWMAAVDFYSDIPLMSFRNADVKYPWKTLVEVLNQNYTTYKLQLDSLNKLIEDIHPEGFITKGSGYFRYEDFSKWCGYGSFNMVDSNTPEGTQTFISLVKSSSVLVDSSKIKLLVNVEFPDKKELLETLDSQMSLKMLKSEDESVSKLESNRYNIDIFKDYVDRSLNLSYFKLVQEENYQAGKYSIIIEYDITKNNYTIQSSHLTYNNGLNTVNQELLTQAPGMVIASKGYLDSSKPLENENLYERDLQTKLLRLYEGLRQASTLSGGKLTINPTSLEVDLQPVIYSDKPEVYGTLLSVNSKSALLKAPAFVTDGSTALKAVIFVSNRVKDNFQGFYGTIPSLSDLTDSSTIFEVPNETKADFASYLNKNPTGMDSKLVFDVYPEFEDLPGLESSFYQTKTRIVANELLTEPVYMTNDYKRELLAITPVFGDIGGGNIIVRDSINPRLNGLVKKDGEYSFEDLTVLDKPSLSYENLTQAYKIQKVMALTQDPKKALTKNPYKEQNFLISGGSVEILTTESKKSYFRVSLKVPEGTKASLKTFLNQITDKSLMDIRGTYLSTLDKDFYKTINYEPLKDSGLTMPKIKVKVTNKTNYYPKKVPITNFEVKISSGEDSVIDTDSTEIIFPAKGYGQALLGEYHLPEDCPFEAGLFFNMERSTLNKLKESFTLVDENFNLIKGARIPAILFPSFEDADRVLKRDLSTGIFNMREALIDLSKFELTARTISTENLGGISLLDFHLGTSEEDSTIDEVLWAYELFLTGTRISCKAFWGKVPVDSTSKYIEDITDWTSRDRKAIPYTRIYLDERSIPINTRYLNSQKSYVLTQTAYTPDFNTLLCDSRGQCVYLNSEGLMTTNLAESASDLVPGISLNSYRKLLKNLSNIFTEGFYEDGILKSGFDLGALKLSRINISSSYAKKDFTIVEDGKLSLYWAKDYSTMPFTYNKISKSTWVSNLKSLNLDFKVKIISPEIQVHYDLNQTKTKYNLVYLRDSNGDLVSKIYFKEPLTEDDLLISSIVN